MDYIEFTKGYLYDITYLGEDENNTLDNETYDYKVIWKSISECIDAAENSCVFKDIIIIKGSPGDGAQWKETVSCLNNIYENIYKVEELGYKDDCPEYFL